MAKAFEQRGFAFTGIAAADITELKLVSIDTTGKVVAATGTSVVAGVINHDVKAGHEVTVVSDGIMPIQAAAAVKAGAKVYADADGKIGATTSNTAVGIALDNAAAGQFVAVLLKL